MPAQPAWFHRLDEIKTHLRTLAVPHLDRHAVQTLFRVRERRARQIMAGLDAIQVGNAVAVDRLALLERLEKLEKGAPFQWEVTRRTRVAVEIEKTRQHLAARRIVLPVDPDPPPARSDWGPGIDLRPGELRITFSGAEDLAAKLFGLSQAMAGDWVGFSAAVEPPALPPAE